MKSKKLQKAEAKLDSILENKGDWGQFQDALIEYEEAKLVPFDPKTWGKGKVKPVHLV